MESSRGVQVILPPTQHLQQQNKPAQHQQPQLSQHGKANRLSVSQALQFTPLTPSVLPAYDRICFPQIRRGKESARLTSAAERKVVQQSLAQYGANKVKERIQALLKSDQLPEYKFKQCPSGDDRTSKGGQPSAQSKHILTPPAQMVLDMTSVDYKYPERRQISFQSQPITKGKAIQASTRPTLPNSVQKPKTNNAAVLPGPNGQMSSITKSSSQSFSLNLPKPQLLQNQQNHSLEQVSPKRQKLSHGESTVQVSLQIRSQRDVADAALQQFQNTLLELFEAQDQLDAGSNTVFETGFFEAAENYDDSEPNLSSKIMEKLTGGLKKLVGMRKLSDLSAEHLRRLQLLCEPLIDKVQTINLALPSDADEDRLTQWKHDILKADRGLLSASLLLHTILGPSVDESLISTEALLWVPSALRNVFENCLIPAIEARPDDLSSDHFKVILTYRDDLRKLLETGRKLLDMLSTVCSQTRGLENAVNPTEFLAAKIIFVQNALVEKGSVLGIQTFEKVRKTAMSSLARIFAQFPGERSVILEEILSSLDRLPSNSRNARQYRLGDGKSIQLISALFMQLVQNTALDTPDHQSKTSRRRTKSKLENLQSINGEDEVQNDDGAVNGTPANDTDANDESDALSRLQNKADKLFDAAAKSAQDIVLYLVGRASKTTKTGDSPYRNVLDLFIEDLITVLVLPAWPSSELMLRIMATKMTDMAYTEKTAAAKNMALECLGTMGSAISTLRVSLPRHCAVIQRDGRPVSEVAIHLSRLAEDQDRGGVRNEDLVGFNGPFAIVSRHLWSEADQGLRNLSACGFFLAQYAKVMSLFADKNTFDETDIEAEPVRVANFLLDSILQIGAGTNSVHNFDAIPTEEAELAYILSVLNMGFCRRFSRIVKTLSSSFSSDQAQVRSRSLKSVVTMLETDPTLLDHDPTIADDVFKCASDDSAMVRDSALSLIARFIIDKPSLQHKGIQRLLECASDAKVGVQKRAIGHLRDIYLKDNRPVLKSAISQVMLRRTVDHEDTVADLSKKTLSEVWIVPYTAQLTQSADLAKTTVAIEDLATNIVACISHDSSTLCPLLKKFLKFVLTNDLKAKGKARELCERVVEILFERTISNQEDRGPLVVLTAFAEADPQLIPPPSLGKLQSYLGNLKTENDLFVFKAVISIFGCVLPHLSATHKPLLLDTQNALMKAISSLGRRTELDTVMSCLQIIDSVLQNTMRLIKLAGSIMLKIKSGAASLAKSQDSVPQLLKLLRIAGAMARYIDLEKYWQQFGQEVKDMKGRSVAGYIALTFLPLTHANQPLKVRILALESLGSLCQSFPAQLNSKSIQETFFSILKLEAITEASADSENLLNVGLKVFDELYAQRSQSKDMDEDKEVDDDQEQQELGKLGGDSRTRDGDSAISMVTGNVAKSTLAVALSPPNENALIATKILASISHQGLTHPKQSLLAFVALGTCPDVKIAGVANNAHRLLHQQHESVCEREYMTAVAGAFDYQREVIRDPQGARLPHYQAKLASCFEVVNTSGTKYVKKFLSGLISRISAKLSSDNGIYATDQVLWTLFAVQNLVFFDFTKVDEVLHTILQLELTYSKKGVEISQLLEAALSPSPVPQVHADAQMLNGIPPTSAIDETQTVADMDTVRQLAPVAATLTILMEGRSYLKRQYGVGRDVRTAITNNKQSKESTKAPTKVHGITGDKFWSKSNAVSAMLDDEAGMVSCCQYFVGLMSTDDEVNVNDNDNLGELTGSVGPVEVHDYVRANTPSGVKRKLSASATSTPAKRGPGRPRKESRRSASISSADDPDADFIM